LRPRANKRSLKKRKNHKINVLYKRNGGSPSRRLTVSFFIAVTSLAASGGLTGNSTFFAGLFLACGMDTEWLQKTCLALPATTEEVKWEHDLCFMVAKKMFCVYGLNEGNIAFKVPDEQFDELSATDGFMPAPYMARAKWVTLLRPEKVNKKELTAYIKQSYELVKSKLPKKLKLEYGL
jgi:predicted DNA-binding protein (MmcQ/YjbR family)